MVQPSTMVQSMAFSVVPSMEIRERMYGATYGAKSWDYMALSTRMYGAKNGMECMFRAKQWNVG